jgi:hypothetical protein
MQDFDAEVDVYQNSPLGKLLPKVDGFFANQDNPAFVDPSGHRLPPCIVMERGESLDEWSIRRKPDVWAAMPVRPPTHPFFVQNFMHTASYLFSASCWSTMREVAE